MRKDDPTIAWLVAALSLLGPAACRSSSAHRAPAPPAARPDTSEAPAPAAARGDTSAVPVPEPAPADSLQAGIALFQQGEYARAEAALREASGPEASAYLAASLAKQRKYVEAEGPARTALEANPIHEVAVPALGASLVGQRRFDEAIQKMTEVLARKPDLAYAYFWRGQAYYGSKKADRMVADFQTFLRLAPNSPEAPVVRQLLSSLG